MGMQKEIFSRYIFLLDLLYRSERGLTLDEIRDALRRHYQNPRMEYPRSTFVAHRADMESIFDINIVCSFSDGYRYRIDDKPSIEENALLRWMVATFAVRDQIRDCESIRQRILLEQMPSAYPHLGRIVEAMKESCVLRLSYRRYRDADTTPFEFEPWLLKVFERRWYVHGLNRTKNEAKTYALDRISTLDPTPDRFRLPEGFNAQHIFEDVCGIFIERETPAETVLLRFDPIQCRYKESLPLHHSQREVEVLPDGSRIFEYHLSPTFDFRQEILRMGRQCEVVSPEWLRRAIGGEIEAMCGMYRR